MKDDHKVIYIILALAVACAVIVFYAVGAF